MKILKSGIEMTPEELIASKAGKACACSCQMGIDTNDMHTIGAEGTDCFCGCMPPPGEYTFDGAASSARSYPY